MKRKHKHRNTKPTTGMGMQSLVLFSRGTNNNMLAIWLLV